MGQGRGSTYTLKARRHRDTACLGAWQLAVLTAQIQNVPERRATLSLDDSGRHQLPSLEGSKHVSSSSPGLPAGVKLVAQIVTCFRRRE